MIVWRYISGPAATDEGAAQLQAATNPVGDDEWCRTLLAEGTCWEAAPSRPITALLAHKQSSSIDKRNGDPASDFR